MLLLMSPSFKFLQSWPMNSSHKMTLLRPPSSGMMVVGVMASPSQRKMALKKRWLRWGWAEHACHEMRLCLMAPLGIKLGM